VSGYPAPVTDGTMDLMEVLPALRNDIEFLTMRLGEQDVIVVRDPLGIATPNTALTATVAPYLPLFNGTSTIDDLRIVMMRHHGGSLVYRADAERIVGALSRLGILQTEAYRTAKKRIIREFTENPERPAVLAGTSYPGDDAELAALLDRILSLPGSPGKPLPGPPCALAAPHIDLRVAERTYGAAYRAIRSLSPSAILLLGTGHALGDTRYCVTDKTFTTPLGRVRADRETIGRIREASGETIAADDFPHRSEHSLEFQLLFLQRLFPMEEIPILPVLCGQMEDLFDKVPSPLEVPGLASFVGALNDWLSEPPGGKLVVAGVDFSHVGPKFGDPHSGRSLEPDFRAYDREILAALVAGDPSAFFRAGVRSRNRHKVCGFSALWTLLSILPNIRGTILDYDIWHEDPTQSAVSFAALAFFPDSFAESLAGAASSSG